MNDVLDPVALAQHIADLMDQGDRRITRQSNRMIFLNDNLKQQPHYYNKIDAFEMKNLQRLTENICIINNVDRDRLGVIHYQGKIYAFINNPDVVSELGLMALVSAKPHNELDLQCGRELHLCLLTPEIYQTYFKTVLYTYCVF